MANIKVKPVNGARVRKENGIVLKPEGEIVERSAFWLRRRNDGAITIEDVADKASARPAEEPVAPAKGVAKSAK